MRKPQGHIDGARIIQYDPLKVVISPKLPVLVLGEEILSIKSAIGIENVFKILVCL